MATANVLGGGLLRITPEEVLAAYRKTGIKVLICGYTGLQGGKQCGCPLSAVYAAETQEKPRADKVLVWAHEKYGEDYADNFVDGVDGNEQCTFTDRERQGYSDVKAVIAAVKEEFEVFDE